MYLSVSIKPIASIIRCRYLILLSMLLCFMRSHIPFIDLHVTSSHMSTSFVIFLFLCICKASSLLFIYHFFVLFHLSPFRLMLCPANLYSSQLRFMLFIKFVTCNILNLHFVFYLLNICSIYFVMALCVFISLSMFTFVKV